VKSRNRRRAGSRRSCPSRSSVRSTSDEIENPISPPNTTAYSVVRLCKPTIWLLNRRATFNDASSTGRALASPITASRFLIVHPAREALPQNRGKRRFSDHTPRLRAGRERPVYRAATRDYSGRQLVHREM